MKKYILTILAIITSLSLFAQEEVQFKKGDWNNILQQAKELNKSILVEVKTPKDNSSKQNNKEAWTDASVVKYLKRNFLLVHIDAEQDEGSKLAKKFNVDYYPTLVFFNSTGEQITKHTGMLSAKKLLNLVKITNSKHALELMTNKKAYASGKLKNQALIHYMDLLKNADLDYMPVLDTYIHNLSDKEKYSLHTFNLISKSTRNANSKPVKMIVENYNKFSKEVDHHSLDKYICQVYVFESYVNTLGYKNTEALFDYLEKHDIRYAAAIKENHYLVKNCLYHAEKHAIYIERSEAMFKEYPMIFPYTIKETIKQAWCSPIIAKHADEAIRNDAKLNPQRAAYAASKLANIYAIKNKDYEKSLEYYYLAREISGEEDSYAEPIAYYQKALGLLKIENYGEQASDFSLPDMDGKIVSLSDLKGKYVLIDFWASWCGPCKGEIPYLKNAHEKYRDKDLVVISITTDENDTAWKKAVKKEGMNWLQLSGNNTQVTKDYGVQGIPRILLLDKEGKIIADKLRGHSLVLELERVLN